MRRRHPPPKVAGGGGGGAEGAGGGGEAGLSRDVAVARQAARIPSPNPAGATQPPMARRARAGQPATIARTPSRLMAQPRPRDRLGSRDWRDPWLGGGGTLSSEVICRCNHTCAGWEHPKMAAADGNPWIDHAADSEMP